MPFLFPRALLYAGLLTESLWLAGAHAAVDQISFQPCPLLRAYYPPLTISTASDAVASFVSKFTTEFDNLVQSGGSDDYGPITPNTTSFSVVLFSGTTDSDDAAFFEYHHTATTAQSEGSSNVTSDTLFPVGDLTQLFTVYAWLVEVGEEAWETPITAFLPELSGLETPPSEVSTPWQDVTIGTLAGQMSGLARDSYACTINKPCDYDAFREKLTSFSPVFLPGTTPMASNVAFQLLAFAMMRKNGTKSFGEVLSSTTIQPLNMTKTELLGCKSAAVFGHQDFNVSQVGEPASLSLLSTTADLARAGNAMLSSRLLQPAVTRRWLHPIADTSNLRNGVGRPWEVYRAGSSAISPIVDIFTKSGAIGPYASYFGLAPDFNAGFAILAHDSTVEDRKLDLNVYADVVSDGLTQLTEMAAVMMITQFVGTYSASNNQSVVAFNQSDYGPGLSVITARLNGTDLMAEVAESMAIETAALDFRLYPTNVVSASSHQFVAVFQNKAAPADMGTPTCITWMDVGSLGKGAPDRFVFEIGKDGGATGLRIQDSQGALLASVARSA